MEEVRTVERARGETRAPFDGHASEMWMKGVASGLVVGWDCKVNAKQGWACVGWVRRQ